MSPLFPSQVRHDLIRCKYPGINYEAENDKILGLVVADMYLEMIKYNTSVEELSKQYKRFTPKPNQRFAKRKFKDILRNIQRKDYDQYYIMESYLSQLNTIGPFYLREEYAGETNYAAGEELASSTSMTSVAHSSSSAQSTRELVPRRNLLPLIHPKSTSCALKIELCPEYRKEPVLKIHFKHTDSVSSAFLFRCIFVIYALVSRGNGQSVPFEYIMYRVFIDKRPQYKIGSYIFLFFSGRYL